MDLHRRFVFIVCLSMAILASTEAVCAKQSPGRTGRRESPANAPSAPPGDGGSALDGTAAAPLIVDTAVSKFDVGPQAGERCMLLAVPLKEAWQIQEFGGRPPLAFTNADRWQFHTTDHWGSGAVRWAVGRAIVTAGGGTPNMSVGVTLGTGASAQADLAKTLSDGSVVVDTGVLQALVRESGFNVLDRVLVDGVEIVKSGQSKGIVARMPDGTPLFVAPGVELSIVENGPAFALLKATGSLQDDNGEAVIDFTCRLSFSWDSRDVQVDFTVRNATILRPQHTSLGSLVLELNLSAGTAPIARVALPGGETQATLSGNDLLYAYQAYSSAPTEETTGSGTSWLAPITKTSSTTYAQEGYTVAKNSTVLFAGNKDQYPANEWLDLSGAAGGCTVTIQHMPYFWPASLEGTAMGKVTAGLFPHWNGNGYTWNWRQHESRTAVFSFHAGVASAPVEVSRRLESPAVGRFADLLIYQLSGCFGYDILTAAEQNLAYQVLGIAHTVFVSNLWLTVTRFLPMGATGGENNHDYIERLLTSEFLRFGTGGQWDTALDLALWKSEWQILRSDDFDHKDDPGADNDEVPHTTNIAGDDEHRYMGGIALAWYMTGDERYRDALFDEAEILPTLDIWPHERSMYQSLVALVEVAAATHQWGKLTPYVHQRLQFFDTPVIDVASGVDGYGWDGPPGQGPRGCYVYSEQNKSEKAPGENYVTRGFITSSMGPRGLYRAARFLGKNDPDAKVARLRIHDLAHYTRDELFPSVPKAVDGHLVYSYGVEQELVNTWETSDFHPILLGMAETWRDTGDVSYLLKGLEQIEAFAAHDNLEWIDKRLEAQHYLRAILDAAKAAGVL